MKKYMLLCSIFLCCLSSAQQNSVAQKTQDRPQTSIEQNKTKPAKAPTLTQEEINKKAEEKEKKRQEMLAASDIKKAEWIEKTIKFGVNKDRKDAVNFIPTVKDSAKKALLSNMLIELLKTESDTGVMVKSLNVASEMKLKEAVPAIIPQLESISEDVRIASVYALKEIDARETKAALFEKLKNCDFTVDSNYTGSLIETLAAFEASECASFAKETIEKNSTTKSYRLSLLIMIGKIKAVELSPFLLSTMKDPNEDLDVRSYAVNSIAKLDQKNALPEINSLIKEIDTYPFDKRKKFYSLYMYCVSALVRLGDASSYSKLEDSLRSDNPTVRIQSIRLIKELKDKRAIDILKYKAEYDPSTKVQSEAFIALKELGIDFKKELEEKNKSGRKDDKVPVELQNEPQKETTDEK